MPPYPSASAYEALLQPGHPILCFATLRLISHRPMKRGYQRVRGALVEGVLLLSLLLAACAPPNDVHRLYARALHEQVHNRNADAHQHWQHILQQRPSLVGPRTNLALIALTNSDVKTARALLRVELSQDPTFSNALYLDAVTSYLNGDTDEALSRIKSISPESPGVANRTLLIARIGLDLGADASTLTSNVQHLGRGTSSAAVVEDAKHLVALAYETDREFSMAESLLRELVQRRRSPVMLYNLAVVLGRQEKYALAEDALKAAEKLTGPAYKIILLRAAMQLAQSRLDDAETTLKLASTLASTSPRHELVALQAAIAHSRKLYRTAVKLWAQCVALKPDERTYQLNLGLAALYAGQLQAGAEALRAANDMREEPSITALLERLPNPQHQPTPPNLHH